MCPDNNNKDVDLSRRRFNRLLATGLAAIPALGAARGEDPSSSASRIEVLPLGPIGWCPNNTALPVLFYRGAIPVDRVDPASRFEQVFTQHGWPPQWRNGVYTFHHYHSTAHEVLGFAAGSAQLVLGGPGGHEVTVRAGDVVLLPVGTGHCELSKTDDFLVVGAYPPSQHWDICRATPDAQAQARMGTLPFPHSDPVHGSSAPFEEHWVSRRGALS